MLVVFVCDAAANNYWDDPANVEAYAAIAAGNDGAALAARLAEWVSSQASVLELGMGTGGGFGATGAVLCAGYGV